MASALRSSFAQLSLQSSAFHGSSIKQTSVAQPSVSYSPLTVTNVAKSWEKKKLNKNGNPITHKVHVKVGDTVQVIAGSDKGKVTEITRITRFNSMVFCKDVNIKTKHQKPRAEGETGQIITFEAPIHSSNVALYSKTASTRSRVGHKVLEDGRKVRYLIKTGEVIDQPYQKPVKEEA